MHVPLGRRERHGAKDCSLDLHRYLSTPFVKSLMCAVEIVDLVSLPAGITNKPWGEWVISVARARLLLTDSTLSRSVFGAQWTPSRSGYHELCWVESSEFRQQSTFDMSAMEYFSSYSLVQSTLTLSPSPQPRQYPP